MCSTWDDHPEIGNLIILYDGWMDDVNIGLSCDIAIYSSYILAMPRFPGWPRTHWSRSFWFDANFNENKRPSSWSKSYGTHVRSGMNSRAGTAGAICCSKVVLFLFSRQDYELKRGRKEMVSFRVLASLFMDLPIRSNCIFNYIGDQRPRCFNLADSHRTELGSKVGMDQTWGEPDV